MLNCLCDDLLLEVFDYLELHDIVKLDTSLCCKYRESVIKNFGKISTFEASNKNLEYFKIRNIQIKKLYLENLHISDREIINYISKFNLTHLRITYLDICGEIQEMLEMLFGDNLTCLVIPHVILSCNYDHMGHLFIMLSRLKQCKKLTEFGIGISKYHSPNFIDDILLVSKNIKILHIFSSQVIKDTNTINTIKFHNSYCMNSTYCTFVCKNNIKEIYLCEDKITIDSPRFAQRGTIDYGLSYCSLKTNKYFSDKFNLCEINNKNRDKSKNYIKYTRK